MVESKQTQGMWGGRFAEGPDALFCAINDSLPVDWRLVQQDVRGSIAWARALGTVGVLSAEEVVTLVRGLERVSAEAAEMHAPPTESGAEDVHSWVEMRLVAMLGVLGKKLHTGRSRNDQVATDLRLWSMEAMDGLLAEVRSVQEALISLGEATVEVVICGYTHLQRAQPVSFAHWCLAYVEMLERDVARAAVARAGAAQCPLGCGALAGTAYPIDRDAIAAELGFDGICRNSLDAVSDRDFVVDALAFAAVCSVHLSRMAEDLIIYASQEFGFVEPDDGMASGSSLMPQKKNPDALELLRGKCGRLMAAHAAMLTTLKGLPLSYNKDLQEDKAILFGAVDELSLCLRIAARVVRGLKVNAERCREAARRGGTMATELADYLVSRGVPFREAHEQVGRIVRASIVSGLELDEMPMEVMREHAPAIGADAGQWLALSGALARRNAAGGTSPQQVRRALVEARRRTGASSPTSAEARGVHR
ncbi:MAG: argininosuccinate lyase [Phycisphaerales bacterium]|nr:argininosuccinate lyase [Phycisphaerales bacterium]